MSKMAAIHTAISLQLADDGKSDVSLDRTLKGPVRADPDYDRNTFLLFLSRVAFRLRIDTPSLIFDYRTIDPDKALDLPRLALEDTIALCTQPADTEPPAAQP
ncbi:MAG TPA: hypothetical protein VMI56_13020 [Reyranella sp.]|nr:hypothetical protein [Reyranella sp.]